MLKLTYTENNLTFEYLQQELSEWVNTRILLALSSQSNFYLQNTTASFLIAKNNLTNSELSKIFRLENLEVCDCDRDFLEVTIKGMWMAADSGSEEGVFITEIPQTTEKFLKQLCDRKQFCYS